MTLLAFGAPADIKKICCFAPVEFDEIQGGHREPGPIAYHTNGTIQFNVGKTVFLCFSFAIGKIAVDLESLPPEGIVIDDEFRIELQRFPEAW